LLPIGAVQGGWGPCLKGEDVAQTASSRHAPMQGGMGGRGRVFHDAARSEGKARAGEPQLRFWRGQALRGAPARALAQPPVRRAASTRAAIGTRPLSAAAAAACTGHALLRARAACARLASRHIHVTWSGAGQGQRKRQGPKNAAAMGQWLGQGTRYQTTGRVGMSRVFGPHPRKAAASALRRVAGTPGPALQVHGARPPNSEGLRPSPR
jgi:hypothetical protein